MDKPKVIILCGGMGTRLREETEFKPKPLVPIGGKPILWHIMNIYSHYGFNDFVLCLGYKGDMIKQYFLNYNDFEGDFTLNLKTNKKQTAASKIPDWNITFADTGLLSETGSRIKQIEKYVGGDKFFLTYGDGVSNVNISDLLKFHNNHGKIATVTTVRPITRFGNLSISNGNIITDFTKKTVAHEGWIDGGFFVFNRKFFDYVDKNPGCMLEGQPLKRLASEGQFVAYKHDGFWQCMDTIRDHQILNEIWASGNAPWKIWKD